MHKQPQPQRPAAIGGRIVKRKVARPAFRSLCLIRASQSARLRLSLGAKEKAVGGGKRGGLETWVPIMEPIETDTIDKRKDEDTGVKTVNQFEIVRPLGKGAFGKVKLCKDTRDGKLYALKIMDKNVLKKKRQGMSNMLQSVQKEIAIMKKLDHKNVVRMFEVLDCPTNPKLYIRIEYVDGGQSMPSENGVPPLDHAKARSYFGDLMNGMQYLHFNNVLHRDIKPENLLVTNEGILKIADFGVSQVLDTDDDMITKSAGTPAFMAPECCRAGAFHGKLADLWACGCTLYFFVNGKCPFINNNVFELYEDIQNNEIEFDASLPADILDLLKKLLDKDPEKRLPMTIEKIKQHPWMSQGGGGAGGEQKLGEQVRVDDDDLANALTESREIVLMVKVSMIMKKRLAAARENIMKRNALKDATAGMQDVDIAAQSAGSAAAASASHSAPDVPEGFAVVEDSDPEDEPETPQTLTGSGTAKKTRGGRCAQQ